MPRANKTEMAGAIDSQKRSGRLAMEPDVEAGDGAQAKLRKGLIPIDVTERRAARMSIGVKESRARYGRDRSARWRPS